MPDLPLPVWALIGALSLVILIAGGLLLINYMAFVVMPSIQRSSTARPTPLPSLPPQDKRPSLNLTYDEVKRVADLALAQADALDAKAGFVLGAASFLVAGITALPAAVSSTQSSHLLVRWLAVIAAIIYLAVAVSAWIAYRVRDYTLAPEPRNLATYMYLNEQVLKTEVMISLLRAYSANQSIIAHKSRWTRRALRAFLVEALFLAVILVVVAIS